MKAEIKADGTLLISAETELEIFALRRWFESWQRDKSFCFGVRGINGAPLFEDPK